MLYRVYDIKIRMTKLLLYIKINCINSNFLGPLKKVYKKYQEDPLITVPKRTFYRHAVKRKLDISNNEEEIEGLADFSSSGDEKDNEGASNLSTVYPVENSVMGCLNYPHSCDSTDVTTKLNGDTIKGSVNSELLAPKDSMFNKSSLSSSSLSSTSESDTTETDTSDQDSVSSDETDIHKEDPQQLYIHTLLSYIFKYNLSGAATRDFLKLFSVLCPESQKLQNITYENMSSLFATTAYKTVHYCTVCSSRFPDDTDKFSCTTEGCQGYRYKGPFSAQLKKERQPRSCFVIADIKKQLQYLLQRKNIWGSIQETKRQIKTCQLPSQISDIGDGGYYRKLCEEGQFLNVENNISAVFNTDGIPLYSSSNVKLWPVYLAINELPTSMRFARENMILAAVWQGKSKPPFSHYMCSFGEEMKKMYFEGFEVNLPETNGSINVHLGVFLATLDLQAKGYVLNMTMHNGLYGCITCEEPGETVKQGKGSARHYPYRPAHSKAKIRSSDDVKYDKGPKPNPSSRLKGITGMTGLAVMSWFDVVLGIVPDYMHGVLLGVTKTLLNKYFSPTHSGKPYFIGKHLKEISKRLSNITPPDYIEHLPRNLEKHYNHFKATELQSWLLFYALPCLKGYLPDKYLKHLSLLSEGIHLLLGDAITDGELNKAEYLLDSFYADLPNYMGRDHVD